MGSCPGGLGLRESNCVPRNRPVGRDEVVPQEVTTGCLLGSIEDDAERARDRLESSQRAESWPASATDAPYCGMSVLTYTIVDWLHAPGARQAHLRRDIKGRGTSRDFVHLLCDQLGENWDNRRLRKELQRIERRLGQELVEQLVEQARVIHAGSGMLVKDGSRRRTLGGVFFQLAKQERRRCALYGAVRPVRPPRLRTAAATGRVVRR